MAEKTYVFGEGNNGWGNGYMPVAFPYGGGFGNGFGSFNSIADLFGLAIIASMFGWGNGGFGGFGGGWGGAGGAGFISNQLNNDSGRELIMNAVTSQGEASRSAIQGLSTMLGQDFNLVNSAVQNVQNALSTIALQQAVSVPQIINSIQSGDAALASQFCQCCCEQKLLTVEQGYQSQIRTLEQTSAISGQADRNTAAIRADIATQTTLINDRFCELEKRELQDKINTLTANNALLRSQIDNAQQTAAITGYVNSVVAPLQKEVTEIANKMPQTVPVQWPQLTAVNTTPYVNGGYYGNAFGGWNGFNNGLVF